jgi:ABC-type microcin C transport system permease subunit YejB
MALHRGKMEHNSNKMERNRGKMVRNSNKMTRNRGKMVCNRGKMVCNRGKMVRNRGKMARNRGKMENYVKILNKFIYYMLHNSIYLKTEYANIINSKLGIRVTGVKIIKTVPANRMAQTIIN